MSFLKNRAHLLLFIIMCGCATSSYQLIRQRTLAAEIKVTPDRIIMECEFQYKDEDGDGDGYGFLMHVLDDANTVVSVVQTNVLDKASCFRRIQKIGKILKTGKTIYIGGMGNITKPRLEDKRSYTFPRFGTFHGNGRATQFAVIANERGLCYDAYSGDDEPCPREPFSLKNLK
jgi:hypothetical protein